MFTVALVGHCSFGCLDADPSFGLQSHKHQSKRLPFMNSATHPDAINKTDGKMQKYMVLCVFYGDSLMLALHKKRNFFNLNCSSNYLLQFYYTILKEQYITDKIP